jgi:hypothetical protein
MQKWKLIIFSLVVASSLPTLVYAEETQTENKPVEEPEPELVQQHVIKMMQDDFSFETQKRSLSNELELAKIRSQIDKLKQESNKQPEAGAVTMIAPPMASPQPAVGNTPQVSALAEVEMNKPKVLLVSQIAGVSRVAVEGDNGVKLVKLNESFAMNGKKYVVSNGHNNTPVLKEAIK